MPEISFYTPEVDYTLLHEAKLQYWLQEVCKEEKAVISTIDYILVSDDFLLEINQKYLNHSTYTDIITFNLGDENAIEGEIYISVDRVEENAQKFNVNSYHEMRRVIIHGLLHLIGYDDQTTSEKKKIRSKEDYYLSKYQS